MVLLFSSLVSKVLSLDEDLGLGLDKGLMDETEVLSIELDLLCLANFNMIDQFLGIFKPVTKRNNSKCVVCDYNHLFACLDMQHMSALLSHIIWPFNLILCFKLRMEKNCKV